MLLQFLDERVEIAKFHSDDQIDIFASMLQRCLSSHVGKDDAVMTRNVAAIGPKFRYY